MRSYLSAILFSVLLLAGCKKEVRIVWTEGEADPQTRRATHTLTVVNAPEGTDWAIWLTSNHIASGEVEGTEGRIDLHHGCLYKMTPYEHSGKNLTVTYTDHPLQRHRWAPEGLVLEHKGKVSKVAVEY